MHARMACQNCDWQGTNAKPIVDYHQRMDDGEPAPAGECPECGALCHALVVQLVGVELLKDPRGVSYYEAGDAPTLEQGWARCGTCGRTWDDTTPTAVTPTPAARCPFEMLHNDDDDDAWVELHTLSFFTRGFRHWDFENNNAEGRANLTLNKAATGWALHANRVNLPDLDIELDGSLASAKRVASIRMRSEGYVPAGTWKEISQ